MSIANNLKYLRRKAEKTIAETAAYLNVCDETPKNWEEGRGEPKVGQLVKLAGLYKCKLDDFLEK